MGFGKREDNMESTSHSSSVSKAERKIVEKNRRNLMKNLYSKLNSLLPDQSSKEAQSIPDQVDEAVSYIKSLQGNLEKLKEKKESLMSSRKRPHTCSTTSVGETSTPSLRSPVMEIREMGSNLQVTLVTGLEDQSIFYDIIGILHEESAEVLSASFSVVGNSAFHVLIAQVGDSTFSFGTKWICDRLNKFVHGSTSEEELQPELWDFEFHPETWAF
ncbi:hypothetical protein VitviT2T_017687 [Vitis vinifera]|uniref:BHLH domain-containing protein n=2 Tax=Vitis vinifera TaxID=29760 RepID=A0ABY9CV56_VITVI|eukprot:XP_002274262.2 PREDICTED: transcription factor bHLH36 [Vitis vinifera]